MQTSQSRVLRSITRRLLKRRVFAARITSADSTEQAQEAIAAETVRIIQCFKESGHVPNAVNVAKHTPATCMLTVRHRDRPGVLARVLDAISLARINVQEMENVVFEGAAAAVAHSLGDRPVGRDAQRAAAKRAGCF